MQKLKVIFTAIGSIGTRHINNLFSICQSQNISLTADVIRKTNRLLPENLKQIIRNQYYSFQDIEDAYDIAFITDETALHFNSIKELKGCCRHMFIEKPVFENMRYSVKEIMPDDSSIYYVAAPIRFTNYFSRLQQAVRTSKVYAARVIFSSYMPDWQKGRDYRKSFRTAEEKGGGVDIDSLHEIDYVKALFGLPEKISRHAGHFSNLEMDACDIADYIFEYKDKLVQIQLDYFGRANNRRMELFCDDEVIICDFNRKELIRQKAGTCENFGPDDGFYYDEMKYFIDLISSPEGKENINPIQKAYQTLGLAKGEIIIQGGNEL